MMVDKRVRSLYCLYLIRDFSLKIFSEDREAHDCLVEAGWIVFDGIGCEEEHKAFCVDINEVANIIMKDLTYNRRRD